MSDNTDQTIRRFISRLKRSSIANYISSTHYIPLQAERYFQGKLKLDKRLIDALKTEGIQNLYSHQGEAIEHILKGDNVLVTTPTASGKTLVYNLPVLEAMLKDPSAKALYLFPYKALGQDQHKTLQGLIERIQMKGKISVGIYDGDTSSYQRKKLRMNPPNIIISNPDMLHYGMLAYHELWEDFLKELRFVVVDELHVYRGIFGSNCLQIFRRLRRICNYYGSAPRYISLSATISNPTDFVSSLFDLPFHVIDKSGAPARGRHFMFIDSDLSINTVAADLFILAIKQGLKTIVFTKARRITEIIYRRVVQRMPQLRDKISSYRAGFLPEERREIEQALFNDRLKGVISTSALELGVDIGGLDVCILVGYPGTITSTFQRSGRVGRGDRESLTVLLAHQDALDQYFIRNPQALFSSKYEGAVVDPRNIPILKNHLVCAAAELPLLSPEEEPFSEVMRQAVQQLEAEGALIRDHEDAIWYSTRKHPQIDVNIRSIGDTYSIVDTKSNSIIGTIDGIRVFYECHPGAIYLHRGMQYQAINIDTERHLVYVKPTHEQYYTEIRSATETEILDVKQKKPVKNFIAHFGTVKVTEQIHGYVKKKIQTGEQLGTFTLDLPPIIFETTALWIRVENFIKDKIDEENLHFMGGLHATEHCAISVFPLFALCDRYDIGGISFNYHPQLGCGAVFIYDGYPGGIGLANRGYEMVEELLKTSLTVINDCDCEVGCPACIYSPKCGSGNKPLDKEAAARVLQCLLNMKPLKEQTSSKKPANKDQPIKKLEKPKGIKVVVFDLETQRSAEEVGGWQNAHLMGVSVGVVWDSSDQQYHVYHHHQVDKIIEHLKSADLVVGFNQVRFDYKVLSGYSAFDFSKLNSLDILAHVKKRIGFRLKLEQLAEHTLNEHKAGDGLQALNWWAQKKLDKLVEYCKKDVEITLRLYQHGLNKGYLVYRNKDKKKVRLPVDFRQTNNEQ